MTQQDNKAASGLVFMRHEIKYRITSEIYPEFMRRTSYILKPDLYPHSNILSIYYDTEHNDLVSRSIEGGPYKEKLRLRSYGIPSRDTIVFPELKKKYAGIVYKRREMMPCIAAERFLNQGILPGRESQILRELDYFRTFYHPMPVLFIGYRRNSFAGVRHPDLRVTFDYDIRYREDRLSLQEGDDGEALDIRGDFLMEIKVRDSIPVELTKILSDMKIYPDSFSKYGTIYRAIHDKPPVQKEKKCLQVS